MQLAGRGYEVVAIDSSQRLLGVLRDSLRSDDAIAARVETIDGEISALPELVSGTTFDVVLCHGVLMYFDDPEPVLDLLADRVEAGGVLSLLVRNRDSLAMRPGTAGRWSEALAAFDATTYVNRLGVQARADRLEDLEAGLARRGLSLSAWYGVRVFTDNAVSGKTPPSSHDLLEIIAAEERAGATDPYRAVAPLLHLVSRRTGGGHESH
jgi:SAM-dependent methyltransferase